MPTKVRSCKGRDGHGAAWHAVLWIATVAITFSVSTISLAAMAEGTTNGYSNDSDGILRSINDLRKDIREINVRVERIERAAVK